MCVENDSSLITGCFQFVSKLNHNNLQHRSAKSEARCLNNKQTHSKALHWGETPENEMNGALMVQEWEKASLVFKHVCR